MKFNLLEYIRGASLKCFRGPDVEKEQSDVLLGMIFKNNPVEIGDNLMVSKYVEYFDYHQKVERDILCE